MKTNIVNWFEIPVLDMPRAKKFYSKLLKVELETFTNPEMEMETFPMEESGINASGALVKSENYIPSENGPVMYFMCNDVKRQVELTEELGGKVLFPKTSIGENGYIAHIIDSEGNRIGLHSAK